MKLVIFFSRRLKETAFLVVWGKGRSLCFLGQLTINTVTPFAIPQRVLLTRTFFDSKQSYTIVACGTNRHAFYARPKSVQVSEGNEKVDNPFEGLAEEVDAWICAYSEAYYPQYH